MHNRIKSVRKHLNIKQADIAATLDVSTATYSRYERGLIKPDIFKLCKIADLLNISIDYLLLRTDIPYLFDELVCADHKNSQIQNLEFINKYVSLDQRSKDVVNQLIEYEYSLTKKLADESSKQKNLYKQQ